MNLNSTNQNTASSAGVVLGQPQVLAVPEVPKDVLACKPPSLWVTVALVELIIIGWLTYRLYQKKQSGR